MQTDLALAASYTVAERTVHNLGLSESVASFHAAENITALTDRVLVVTVSAPSGSEAVTRARTLATEFIQFRAEQLQAQQQLVLAGLDQQINKGKQHIASLTAQIRQPSQLPAQQARRRKLLTQRSDAVTALGALQQATDANQASAEVTTATEIKGTQVLDAAAATHHSPLKFDLIYAFMGLFVGLMLGLAIIIIRALVSDRLRRRDDIAGALGAPVGISAGKIRASASLPGWPGRRAAQDRDIERIVAQLRASLPKSSSEATAAFAVVSVDNEKVAARLMTALALSCAQRGWRVAVADLCSGAPAAHLLGAGQSGVQRVAVDGAHLTVVVPDDAEILPVGPVQQAAPTARSAPSDGPLASLYARADVLLTLVNLDPAVGAEHLRTWATDAVPVVSAGQSSWVRIHSVGEMVRLAQLSLAPAVLIGADKSDESLGLADSDTIETPAGPRVLGR
jgi:hypothetical protein